MATLQQVGLPNVTTFLDWRTRTNDIIDLLNISLDGSPVLIQTMREIFNYIESAGVFTGCSVTDNGNGTVDISSGEALLRIDSTEGSEIRSVSVPATANISLTNLDLTYIYANYVADLPATVLATTTVGDINGHNKCLIAIISYDAIDSSVTILEAKSEMADQHNKLSNMLIETEGFKHVLGGTTLSESDTPSLTIDISAGSFYRGLTKTSHSAYATNIAGGDTFELYYHTSGAWTEISGQTQIDTTKYDNGTDLTTMTVNKIGINWVYLKLGTASSELFVFVGSGQYDSVAEAQIEAPPTGLPNQLDEMGVLIGRVLFIQGDTSFSATESSFGNLYSSDTSSEHNKASGIQGGQLDQYYHLNAAEHTAHLAHVLDTTDNNPHGLTPEGIGAEPEGTSAAMALALG